VDSARENNADLQVALMVWKRSLYLLSFLTQGKDNEKLRIVLEENVALQKRLIKLEGHYLKSRMKSSPITQIKGECECQWENVQCLAVSPLCFFYHVVAMKPLNKI